MDEAPLVEYAKLLDEVVDIYRVLVDPRVEPRPASPGAEELTAAQQQSCPAGTWGEAPVREAYALAILNYQVALDHATAIATLTRGAQSAVSASVLARALVEAASQAWWLLEPGIGHVKRVARSAALRYRSATEGEKAATADGVPTDEHSHYTETKTQVEQYANDLGLGALSVDKSKGRIVYVCGTERLPTPSKRVEMLFGGIDLPSVYPVFSGYSHGEVYALLRDFELLTRGDIGTRYRSVVNKDSFQGAVAIASYAIFPPGERLSKLFGLDNS
jgi:hypothetical protein